jgi:hypothetical protein
MKNQRKTLHALSAAAAAAAATVAVNTTSAATITEWSFSNSTGAAIVTSSPAPSTGSGTATSLGMTNSYTFANGEGPGSVDGSNIVKSAVASTADTSFSEFTWKVVGNNNTKNSGANQADGWNNSAPNYTQGAQFQVSTVGYTGVGFSFDWNCTAQGIANMQVRYSTNGGTSWTNLGTDYVANAGGDFYGATSTSVAQPNISIDLSGIAAANNAPNLTIEMVAVRPVAGDLDFSTGTGPGVDGNYASATGDGSGATSADYNNSSGNWSFDNIAFTGTATPEPGTVGLMAVAGLGLLARRHGKKAE